VSPARIGQRVAIVVQRLRSPPSKRVTRVRLPAIAPFFLFATNGDGGEGNVQSRRTEGGKKAKVAQARGAIQKKAPTGMCREHC
jgi:hypothetical protein